MLSTSVGRPNCAFVADTMRIVSTPGRADEASGEARLHTSVVGGVIALALTAVVSALAGSVTAADVVEPLPVLVWLPVTSCVISVLAILAAGWDLTGRGASSALRATAILAAIAPLAVVAAASGDWSGARFVDEAGSVVWTLTGVVASSSALLVWAGAPRRGPRGSVGLGIASGAGCAMLVVLLAIAAAVPYLQTTEAVVLSEGSQTSEPADVGTPGYRLSVAGPIHAVGPGFAHVRGSTLEVIDGPAGTPVWSYDLGEVTDSSPTAVVDASTNRTPTVTVQRGHFVAVLDSFSGRVEDTRWAGDSTVDDRASYSDLVYNGSQLEVSTLPGESVTEAVIRDPHGVRIDAFTIPGPVEATAQTNDRRVLIQFSQQAPLIRIIGSQMTIPVALAQGPDGHPQDVVAIASLRDRFLIATHREIFTVDSGSAAIVTTTPSPCAANAAIRALTVVRGAVIVTCSDVATGRSEVVGMR